MEREMSPHAQWLAKLEQTLQALGIETGYPADALKVAQAEFIAAQHKKEGENE